MLRKKQNPRKKAKQRKATKKQNSDWFFRFSLFEAKLNEKITVTRKDTVTRKVYYIVRTLGNEIQVITSVNLRP